MFPYTNRLADVTAQFPTTVMTPQDVRNLNEAGTLLNESGTVPALVDVEGKRRLNLDQVPVEQAGMDIRVATALRSLIPWGEAPGIGQVAVDMVTGALEFNAADAGLAVTAEYRGKGTPLMGHVLNKMQREIEAAQTRLAALGAPNNIAITGGSVSAGTVESTADKIFLVPASSPRVMSTSPAPSAVGNSFVTFTANATLVYDVNLSPGDVVDALGCFCQDAGDNTAQIQIQLTRFVGNPSTGGIDNTIIATVTAGPAAGSQIGENSDTMIGINPHVVLEGFAYAVNLVFTKNTSTSITARYLRYRTASRRV